MQERHQNRNAYFQEQTYTTQKYVIPFIDDIIKIDNNISILEIGCGEGGNLVPFANIGCNVLGIDLSEKKIENAKLFFKDHENSKNVRFICDDIYNESCINEQFDLIFMRDVLEHIHNQEKFLHYVKRFLKPQGKFFLGFPPWQNPFGGHQQMCKSKLLSNLPFWHILPMPLYKGIMKIFGEHKSTINALVEIKETRISIERFKKIAKNEKYKIEKEVFYFINPNYEVKFKLKVRKQLNIISLIPYFRNYTITTCYYLISLE